MSTFNDLSAEPKQVFLNFLIANDFKAGQLIAAGYFPEAMFQIDFIVLKIQSILTKEELGDLAENLNKWILGDKPSNEQIRESYRKLSKILNEKFYNDLSFSLVQTATLETETDPRANRKPIDPKQSSRIR